MESLRLKAEDQFMMIGHAESEMENKRGVGKKYEQLAREAEAQGGSPARLSLRMRQEEEKQKEETRARIRAEEEEERTRPKVKVGEAMESLQPTEADMTAVELEATLRGYVLGVATAMAFPQAQVDTSNFPEDDAAEQTEVADLTATRVRAEPRQAENGPLGAVL